MDVDRRHACLSAKSEMSYADLDERSLRSLAENVLTRKCRLLRHVSGESFALRCALGISFRVRYNAAEVMKCLHLSLVMR